MLRERVLVGGVECWLCCSHVATCGVTCRTNLVVPLRERLHQVRFVIEHFIRRALAGDVAFDTLHRSAPMVHAPNGACKAITCNFYGTNPMGNSTTISRTAWKISERQSASWWTTNFLQNKANGTSFGSFKARKITRHFSSSKPTGDNAINSMRYVNAGPVIALGRWP